MRESAILGTLSIYTLGFHVAGAIDDFKMDTAAVLLIATGLLSLAIDATSRSLRGRLRVAHLATSMLKGAPRVAPAD